MGILFLLMRGMGDGVGVSIGGVVGGGFSEKSSFAD